MTRNACRDLREIARMKLLMIFAWQGSTRAETSHQPWWTSSAGTRKPKPWSQSVLNEINTRRWISSQVIQISWRHFFLMSLYQRDFGKTPFTQLLLHSFQNTFKTEWKSTYDPYCLSDVLSSFVNDSSVLKESMESLGYLARELSCHAIEQYTRYIHSNILLSSRISNLTVL